MWKSIRRRTLILGALAVGLIARPSLAATQKAKALDNGRTTPQGLVMSDDRFWSLIGRTTAYAADQDRQLDALRRVLRELSAADIEAFERAFEHQQLLAYSWDVWGAAHILNGGASDDGFEYFQRWLISRGRMAFEAVVADPDSLVDWVPQDAHDPCEFEAFATIASDIWGEKTGIDPWKDLKSTFPYTGAPPALKPSGTQFSDDPAYLSKRYPRLWKRFGLVPLQ